MKKITLIILCLFCMVTFTSAEGLIQNWDFSETTNAIAPAGWVPASVMGGKGKSRVHNLKSETSSNDYAPISLLNPENVSAFYFRYDYNVPENKTYTYGTESGYMLLLEPETEYKLTFRYAKWIADDNVANRSFVVGLKDADGEDAFSKEVIVTGTGSVAISKSADDCYDFSESFTTGSFAGTQNYTLNLTQGEGDVAFVITKIKLAKANDDSQLAGFQKDNFIEAYSSASNLYVEAPVGVQVEIYNTLGVMVKSYLSTGSSETLSLSKGIYIIKAGNSIKKVIVK